MKIEIIHADYQNVQHSKDLVYLLNAYASDPMGGSKALEQNVIDNLTTELAKLPYAFSCLAYVDGTPAGLINCFEAFSTFKCKPLINIHDITVITEFRGLGISHLMLKEVEEIATSKGCCKLTLEVLSKNTIAKSCYKKFGFHSYELDPKSGTAVFWEKDVSC